MKKMPEVFMHRIVGARWASRVDASVGAGFE
jgi:hypothetical protein